MAATIIKGAAFEKGASILMARLQGASGSNITQASLIGITYSVFDRYTGLVLANFSAVSLSIASVIFDALQAPSNVWTIDSTGYNFRHDPPALTLADSFSPDGKRGYRYEYKFDPVSGEDFWVVFEIDALAIMTS